MSIKRENRNENDVISCHSPSQETVLLASPQKKKKKKIYYMNQSFLKLRMKKERQGPMTYWKTKLVNIIDGNDVDGSIL